MDSFIVKAPTRVDLAGGTLDLWPLYTLFGNTKTINCAIGLNAIAEFSLEPHTVFKAQVSTDTEVFLFYEPVLGDALEKVPVSVRFPVFVLSRYLHAKKTLPKFALSVHVKTEAPLRSGLGGSSALCVALARGMSRVFSDFTQQGWKWELLSWVKDVEAGFLKTPTGTQDYLAALFGGLNVFEFREGKIEQTAYEHKVYQEFCDRLLVLFSGEMHHSGLSNWEIYKKALESHPETLRGLAQIKEISNRLDNELKAPNLNWSRVGECLTAEWDTRREMFHVETPRLTEIIQFLQQRNVLGSKVCGAAQGGSLIALIDPAHRQKLALQCEERGIQVLQTAPTLEGVTISS